MKLKGQPYMPTHDRQRSLRVFIRRSRRRLAILLVLGVLLIAVGLSAWLSVPGSRRYRVRISGGIAPLNRHKVAEYLKRHGADWHLDFEIRPTEGTVEAVRLVDSGELDRRKSGGKTTDPRPRAKRPCPRAC